MNLQPLILICHFNSLVRVTNKTNKQSVVVRINDRGPFSKNRIIDVSKAAAEKLDMIEKGTIHVTLEVLEPPKNRKSSNE
jgi:rare lipoprotein A